MCVKVLINLLFKFKLHLQLILFTLVENVF
jgi:hypothetical protein